MKLIEENFPAETLARIFHARYEELAPQFGYETRKESACEWQDVPENNRKLMTAVCEKMLDFFCRQNGVERDPK
jgi:hypothetical protein